MFRMLILAAVVPCLLGISSGAAQSPAKSAVKDYHGDPLPTEALARLGSLRMRLDGGISNVVFSPDNRAIAVTGTVITKIEGTTFHTKNVLQLWDLATGKVMRDFEGMDRHHDFAFSPDGKTLAVLVNYPPSVSFWNAASGKKLSAQVKLTEGIWKFALSPDGKLAALVVTAGRPSALNESEPYDIVVWDMAKAKPIARLKGHNYGVQALAFSADSKQLSSASIFVNYAKQPPLLGKVILWDVAKAAKVREFTHESTYVQLSPDGSLVAWAASKGNKTFVVDVRTKCEPVPIAGVHHSFLFSPDSKTLVTGTQGGTISFWDTTTGQELRRLDGHVGQSSRVLRFSGDGKLLATSSWDRGYWSGSGHLRIWDVKSGKEINPVPVHADRITSVAYSPDGALIVSGSNDKSVRLWQAATGKPLRLLAGHEDSVTAVVFAPDGRTLASAAADKSVRLWDVASGKEKHQHTLAAAVLSLAFTPDGKNLLAAAADGSLISCQGDDCNRFRLLEKDISLKFATLAPDARTMAGQMKINFLEMSSHINLWQTPFGKPLGNILIPGERREFEDVLFWTAAFSPDGRYVATSESKQTFALRRILSDHRLRIWEVASNKEVLKIGGLPTGSHTLAFSPDGRFVLSTHGEIHGWGGKSDRSTLVWDAVTGLQVANLGDRNGPVSAAAFSPTGKSLVTGNFDYTLLTWDMTRFAKAPDRSRRMAAAELKKAWEYLGGNDAPAAYRTVARLSTAPVDTVPFLAKELRPMPPVDRKRIDALIDDLNSDTFSVRFKASRELENMGESTELALRQALGRKGSLEFRRRIETLLQKLNQTPTAAQIQFIRALTALERINNDASRKLLQILAAGAPEGRLTQEVRAVLLRNPGR